MFLIFLLALFPTVFAQMPSSFTCALATGFQPYQYMHAGKPAGFDVELFQIILHKKSKVELHAMPWRDAVAQLEFGVVDCVLGMEMSKNRLERFTFTPQIYTREVRIFVPTDSSITNIQQLKGKIVANDKGSELFRKLQRDGIADSIRLLDVSTKAESFELMRRKKVVAMIGPKRVVQELASKSKFGVRELSGIGVNVPVAIAFKKPEHPLLLILKTNMLQQDVAKKLQQRIHSP
jgi:ABC-type amino acid transport substrate-binding protein